LIGSALTTHLLAHGHEVVPIVRGAPGPGEIHWDPAALGLSGAALRGIDAVVHLAGAGVGDHRWTESYKREIAQSRLLGTDTLARALAEMDEPPAVLLSASAVGYYGDRGDEVLTEASKPGEGFLAELCVRWEAATGPASARGVRVVHLRTGVVLSAGGGALKKQLLPFRAGLGARLGSGTQQFSWITRRDAIAALTFILEHDEVAGPVNITGPGPVTNKEFTKALGLSLHRPAIFAVPELALRLALGSEMASEVVLPSQRVLPQRLLDAGFSFTDGQLAGALATALDDRSLVPAP
jgi:uncharacterized protein (TIGR01777 family)